MTCMTTGYPDLTRVMLIKKILPSSSYNFRLVYVEIKID